MKAWPGWRWTAAALLLRRLGNTNWLVPWQQIGVGRITRGDQLCDFTLLAELCGSR